MKAATLAIILASALVPATALAEAPKPTDKGSPPGLEAQVEQSLTSERSVRAAGVTVAGSSRKLTISKARRVTDDVAFEVFLEIDDVYDWGTGDCQRLARNKVRCVGYVLGADELGAYACNWWTYVRKTSDGIVFRIDDVDCFYL